MKLNMKWRTVEKHVQRRGVSYLPWPNLLFNLHIPPCHMKAESNNIILLFIQHIKSAEKK